MRSAFSIKLLQLMFDREMTQKQLADKMGVCHTCVCKWVNGYTAPSLEKAVQIADIFDISLDALCGRCTDGKST